MKIKVQAQHLKPGDVVGSGEVVVHITVNAVKLPTNQVAVTLLKHGMRAVLWGKYTMINVEREDAKAS